MRAADKKKALELRIKHQWGYGMISKELKVPKSTLSAWLKDLPLSEERVLELRREAWSRGEASRERFRQTMRKKQETERDSVYKDLLKKMGKISKQSIFVAGLMLYWAEGTKRDYYSISLANTDSQLIRFFIWWLQKFLKVRKAKMKMQLHLYESMDIAAEQRFWLRETGFSKQQLYKTQIRALRPGSFSYPESFRHGTCQIYVHGKKYKTELMLSIKAFLDTYSRF